MAATPPDPLDAAHLPPATPERAIRNPLDPRNPLAGIYLSTTLFELAEGALRFLVPLHLNQQGLGPEAIGIVLFAFAAASLLARGFTAGVYTHVRARRLIFGAGLASTVAYLLVPFVQDSVVLFGILLAIDGFGWGVATTTLLAVMMVSTPKSMSSAVAMGWFVGFQGIAFAIATTVAGVLADRVGIQNAMLVLATLPVVAATLVALKLPRPDRLEEGPAAGIGQAGGLDARRRGRVRHSLGRAWRQLAGLPFAVWAAATVALYLNVMNGILASFYPLLGLGLGLTFAQIGSLSSMRSAVSSVARFGAGWLFARIPAHRLHLPLLTLSAATVAILPSLPSYATTFPAFMLNGASRGLLRVTTGAAAMDAMQGQQAGLGAAAMTAGLDVGKMIGPLVGGFVAGAFGLDVMFRVVPLALLGLYVVLYLLTPRARTRPAADATTL